jgi:hypothetical protein
LLADLAASLLRTAELAGRPPNCVPNQGALLRVSAGALSRPTRSRTRRPRCSRSGNSTGSDTPQAGSLPTTPAPRVGHQHSIGEPPPFHSNLPFQRTRPRLDCSRPIGCSVLPFGVCGLVGPTCSLPSDPETLVSSHRAGFRLFWRWRSRQAGRPNMTRKCAALSSDQGRNGDMGALRSRCDLLQLSFGTA